MLPKPLLAASFNPPRTITQTTMTKLRLPSTVMAIWALPLFLFSSLCNAQSIGGEVEESFKNVDVIRIEMVSGHCIVKRGRGDQVNVEVQYTYDDYEFEPELRQRGHRLLHWTPMGIPVLS